MSEDKKPQKQQGPFDWILTKALNTLPKDPLTQTHFTYRLISVVCLSFLVFGIDRWINLLKVFNIETLFYALLMTCFFLLTLMNFKGLRSAYHQMKSLPKQNTQNIDPAIIEAEIKRVIDAKEKELKGIKTK